jgi:hypothetical protein
MRRRVKLAAVGLLLTPLAACGGGSNATTSSTASTSTQASTCSSADPPLQASSLLLTVNDLPAGWSVDNSANSAVECLNAALKSASPLSYAHQNFASGGSLPELGEQAGVYASGSQAFAKEKASLDGCTSFTVTQQGQTETFSVGATSFPPYGNESAAYTASATISGTAVAQGVVLVRKGNSLVLVGLGDVAPLNTTQLEHFTALAVAKVPA